MKICYEPIGYIRSPYKSPVGMPIQPSGAEGVEGRVEVFPEYEEGLKDLDGFSHIILIYHFHESRGYRLKVKPFLDDEVRGVFATRAPKRPNPIGLSVVRLLEIEGNTLRVADIDVLDMTPLLDIKPFVPPFDVRCGLEEVKIGWLESRISKANMRSDDRFLASDR